MRRRNPRPAPAIVLATLLAAATATSSAVAQDDPGAETAPSAVDEDQPPPRTPYAGTAADLAAGHAHVTRRSIGTSFSGRSLDLLSIGPPDATWAALVVAGLNGRRDRDECTLALDVAAWLVEHTDDLPADCVFHVLADGNPDASAAAATGFPRAGNDRPEDDDHDGRADEDGPDDVDGDGRIGWMRVPDPTGAWRFDDDGRPERAERDKGLPGTHRIIPEGRDDDDDGEWNEDGPGGTDLSRNFTWRFDEHSTGAGRWPGSESETRAIIDLLVAEERIALVYELGAAETVTKTPSWKGAWKELDDEDDELLDGLQERHDDGPLEEREKEAPGAGSLGTCVWHQLGRVWLGRAPLGRHGDLWPEGDDSEWPDHLAPSWTPIASGGVPPGSELLTIAAAEDATTPIVTDETDSIGAFLRDTAAARAVVEFTDRVADGSPGVLRLRTRIVNTGGLPTHTKRGAELRARRPLNVRIDLPDGAKLLAGRPHVQIERLAPGAAGEELAWVVSGASGGTVRVVVTGPDTRPATLEASIR